MIEMLFMILKRVGFIVIRALEEGNHSSQEVAEV